MSTEFTFITLFIILLSALKYWADRKSAYRDRLMVALIIFMISAFWVGFLTNDLMEKFSTSKCLLAVLFTYSLFENYFKRIKGHFTKATN